MAGALIIAIPLLLTRNAKYIVYGMALELKKVKVKGIM